ncbi:MAG TPA: hypothetical protein VFR02_03580 [bacterium]|nr:hypothetical protein [bacterium]
MPKVYVPHKPEKSLEYGKARAYGEIVVIFEGSVLTHNHGMVEKFLKVALADFNPAEDYMVLSGSRFVIALAVALLLGRHGKVRILQYSSRNDSYEPYELDLGIGSR